MRLLRLYILNSGIFKNTVIDFTDNGEPQDMICLSGVNGCGKTTIMELIFYLANFINPKLTPKDIAYDRLKSNILTRTEFAQLDILLESNKLLSLVLGDEKNIQKDSKYHQDFIIENELKSLIKEFEDNIVKQRKKELDIDSVRKMLFENDFVNRNTIKRLEESSLLFEKIEKNLNKDLKTQLDNGLPYFYFFNAHDREIRDIRYSNIPQDEFKYDVAHRYNPSEDSDDLTKTILSLEYDTLDDSDTANNYKKLLKWVNKNILENKEIIGINRRSRQVIIKTKNDVEHSLELLSAGEESLLIIAIHIWFKASKNTVILIDEIDQSLHPEYQEKIMHIIKRMQKEKQCQFIVSSHSRFIWNAFDEKEIIRLTELVR